MGRCGLSRVAFQVECINVVVVAVVAVVAVETAMVVAVTAAMVSVAHVVGKVLLLGIQMVHTRKDEGRKSEQHCPALNVNSNSLPNSKQT